MRISYEEAKKLAEKANPKLKVSKGATYNGSHIFFFKTINGPFAKVDPICIDAETGAISIYIPKDEKTFREVGRLLK